MDISGVSFEPESRYSLDMSDERLILTDMSSGDTWQIESEGRVVVGSIDDEAEGVKPVNGKITMEDQ